MVWHHHPSRTEHCLHYFEEYPFAAVTPLHCVYCAYPLVQGPRYSTYAKCRSCPLAVHTTCAPHVLGAELPRPRMKLGLSILGALFSLGNLMFSGLFFWNLFIRQKIDEAKGMIISLALLHVAVLVAGCYYLWFSSPAIFGEWFGNCAESHLLVRVLLRVVGPVFFGPLIWLFPNPCSDVSVSGHWLSSDLPEARFSPPVAASESATAIVDGLPRRAMAEEAERLRAWRDLHVVLMRFGRCDTLAVLLLLEGTIGLLLIIASLLYGEGILSVLLVVFRLASIGFGVSVISLSASSSLASWLCSTFALFNNLFTVPLLIIAITAVKTPVIAITLAVVVVMSTLTALLRVARAILRSCLDKPWQDRRIWHSVLDSNIGLSLLLMPVAVFLQIVFPSFVAVLELKQASPTLDLPAVIRLMNFVRAGDLDLRTAFLWRCEWEERRKAIERGALAGQQTSLPRQGTAAEELLSRQLLHWSEECTSSPHSTRGDPAWGSVREATSAFASSPFSSSCPSPTRINEASRSARKLSDVWFWLRNPFAFWYSPNVKDDLAERLVDKLCSTATDSKGAGGTGPPQLEDDPDFVVSVAILTGLGLLEVSLFIFPYCLLGLDGNLRTNAFVVFLGIKTFALIGELIAVPFLLWTIQFYVQFWPILHRFRHTVVVAQKLDHPQRQAMNWISRYYIRFSAEAVLQQAMDNTIAPLLPLDVIQRCSGFICPNRHIDFSNLSVEETEAFLSHPLGDEFLSLMFPTRSSLESPTPAPPHPTSSSARLAGLGIEPIAEPRQSEEVAPEERRRAGEQDEGDRWE
jgi:hypothetical protein